MYAYLMTLRRKHWAWHKRRTCPRSTFPHVTIAVERNKVLVPRGARLRLVYFTEGDVQKGIASSESERDYLCVRNEDCTRESEKKTKGKENIVQIACDVYPVNALARGMFALVASLLAVKHRKQ